MMIRLFIVLGAMFVGSAAMASSEGAAWGSADPDSFNSCAACHFDNEPVGRSPAITIGGLPEYASAGGAYELTLRFEASAEAQSGFLVTASSGAFEAIDEFMEARGNEIRSVKAAPAEDGAVVWRFQWRADAAAQGAVIFNTAVNAGNADRSPFGDKVHFRKFEFLMRANEE